MGREVIEEQKEKTEGGLREEKRTKNKPDTET